MSIAIAVACAGAAAGLLVWTPERPPGGLQRWRAPAVAGGAVVVATVSASVAGHPRLLVLGMIAGAAAIVVARLWTRSRHDRAARYQRARVVELCEVLQAELSAGQAPLAALARAATDWPLVEPAVRMGAAGGDVPAALREASTRAGAGDLRILAAAWQVAHRTGHGLADAVARVAAELRASEQTRRVVLGELASARATARLVAALPVLAWLIGSGAGGDPWSFLLGSPAGLACLAGGLAFGLAGWAWIEAIARDVERSR